MPTSSVDLNPPGIKTKEILQKIAKYEAPSSGAPAEMESEWPLVWAEGNGAEIKDAEGNTYVDLTAGFAVANLGYCHPKLVEAVTEQLGKLTHCRSRSPNLPRAILLEMLSKLCPGQDRKIHFATGGAEAVEVAWKMVKLHTKRQEVLTFYGSWHGRTHATLSLSGMKGAKQGVYPLVPGAVFVPYPYCYRCPFKLEYPDCDLCCTNLVETAVKDSMSGGAEIAAMIVEPIQGYGGHVVPPDEFLPSLRKICNENNLVLIVDEIYTGFGRTGKMFAVEHYGVIPDIHIMGKGITSGFPFSAVVGRSEIMDAGRGTTHSMTFQANPVFCAAAIASLKILDEEKLVESSAEKGQYFMKRLRELGEANEIIGDVRGKGLLIGVELVENRRTKEPALGKAKELTLSAARRGVMVDVAARGNILRITPPLVITREQIDKALNGLEAAFRGLKHS